MENSPWRRLSSFRGSWATELQQKDPSGRNSERLYLLIWHGAGWHFERIQLLHERFCIDQSGRPEPLSLTYSVYPRNSTCKFDIWWQKQRLGCIQFNRYSNVRNGTSFCPLLLYDIVDAEYTRRYVGGPDTCHVPTLHVWIDRLSPRIHRLVLPYQNKSQWQMERHMTSTYILFFILKFIKY